MIVLLLGEKSELLKPYLEKADHFVIRTDGKIDLRAAIIADFIISFGYKFIITPEIIEVFTKKIINLHISYLPFNRGADPNLWSFLENTRKGVTIHRMTTEIDTGDILAQKTVVFDENETLQTSYDKLIKEMVAQFAKNLENIMSDEITPFPQTGKGSYHQKNDKNKYLHLLTKKGYDTPVAELKGKALINNKLRG